MAHLELALKFIETTKSVGRMSQLVDRFRHDLTHLGFTHFACCTHVDPRRPPEGAMAIVHYPEDWINHFSARGYARIDPVFHRARHSLTPFRWADLPRGGMDAAQLRLLEEARDIGLARGIIFPLQLPGFRPASCSLVEGPDGIDPASLASAHLMVLYFHAAVVRLAERRGGPAADRRLRPREVDCLTLWARGKSEGDIGVLLGISGRTVHHHLEHAKGRFGVATRQQALIEALATGQLMLDDIEPDAMPALDQ